MTDHHAAPTEPYDPARDYGRFMRWAKWGGLLCIVLGLALLWLIGLPRG